jgi:hypothetical protein
MWNLADVEAAFECLKQIKLDPHGPPLDVWWSDEGLCVFGTLNSVETEKRHPEIFAKLKAASWIYESNSERFGEVCWYLWRSD